MEPNYFLENQKVILEKFWKNKRTVTSGIGVQLSYYVYWLNGW